MFSLPHRQKFGNRCYPSPAQPLPAPRARRGHLPERPRSNKSFTATPQTERQHWVPRGRPQRRPLPRSNSHWVSGSREVPVILVRIPRRGRRGPDKTPRSPLSPGGCGVPRPGGRRGTPAERSSGPLPGPAGWGRAGASAAPLGTGEGRAARFRLGRGYLPREEARRPGATMGEAAGALDRAPAAAAAAAPGCAQQPLPRARPRRPPAAPLGAHRSARCRRPAERLRPVQERPAGQSPHTPGALEWRTLPPRRQCEWAVGAAMLYGS